MVEMFWMEPEWKLRQQQHMSVRRHTIIGNDLVFHVVIPKLELDEFLEQPRAHDLELASKDTSRVDVAMALLQQSVRVVGQPLCSPRIRLETLVEAQDLTGRGRRHGRTQKRVPHANALNPRLQLVPIPQVRWRHTPQIELELALARGTTLPALIRALGLRHVRARLRRRMIDGLKDLDVQRLGLGRVERHAERHEGVGEPLNTDADGAVAHVRAAGFRDRVIVDIYDPVEIERDDLRNVV